MSGKKNDMIMKKVFLFISIAALTCGACSKEIEPVVDAEQKDEVIDEQEPEVIPGESQDFVFSTVITKTALQESGSVHWSEGDKIKLIYDGGEVESEPAQINDDGSCASFKVTLPSGLAGDTKVYAVYPSDAAASLSEGTLNVTIPAAQSATFAKANIIAARTTLGAALLNFRHICSYLNFNISEGNAKNISKAYFTDLYGTAVVGTLPLSFNERDEVIVGEPTSTSTEIELTGVTEGANYIAVLPGTELKSMAMKLGTESDTWYTPIASNKPHTADKGLVKYIGVLDKNVDEAFYVKSASELEDLLDTSDDDVEMKDWKKRKAAFRLDGYEIRVAAGEYKLTNYLNPVPSSPISFTIKGEGDVTLDATVSKKVIAITDNANISFENLKFANGSNSGVSITGGKQKFTSCTFHNNKSGGSGGGLWITTADVTFEGCTFTLNQATTTGGAIQMNPGENNVDKTIVINNCLFGGTENENQVKNFAATAGGALYLTNCIAKVSNTRFYKSTLTTQPDNEANGAAVYLGDSMEASFDNCDWRWNWGGALRHNGGVYVEGRKVTLNGCLFWGNTCKYRGGAIRATSNTPLFINGCQFYNNKANGQGGHLSQQSGVSFVGINNSTFYRADNFNQNNTSDKADTWMNGKSAIVNSSFVGSDELQGSGAPLVLRYSDNFDGSVLVNNVVYAEKSGSGFWGSPRFSVNSTSNENWRVYGYYNLMSNVAGTSKLYSGTSDVIGGLFSGVEGVGTTTNYVVKLDYTKADGPKPTLKQVEDAIRGPEGSRKGGYYEQFYQWLLEVDGLAKDGYGNTRTDANNRPGSLVK